MEKRSLLSRLLLLGILALLLRLAFVVTIRGGACSSADFCFSSPSAAAAQLFSFSRGFYFSGDASFLRDGSTVRQLWTSKEWRKAVGFYSSIFQDLVVDGFVSPAAKCLCVATASGHEVLALREIGVSDAIGVSEKGSPPLVLGGDLFDQGFGEKVFDFVFVGRVFDRIVRPAGFAAEIARVLKPGGFLVMLSVSSGDLYSLNSLEVLLGCCKRVRMREIKGLDESKSVLWEIVFRKEEAFRVFGYKGMGADTDCNVIPDHRQLLLRSAEALIEEEPLKPWITLKKNIKNIKYASAMVDLSFKQRYVYVDVGARSYGSSIGSWFKKQYPKQNRTFEVYAIEADRAFHGEYASRKGVNLLPFAAWVRNESISFEVNHDPDPKSDEKGSGMGRIRAAGDSSVRSSGNLHMIQGFDFAEWLMNTVTEKDFVVVKMDVEGTEFDLVPRLVETGAIHLIDELFLECHYNRWQRCCPGKRSPKYQKTYGQCIHLFSSLRERGVLVHQWW